MEKMRYILFTLFFSFSFVLLLIAGLNRVFAQSSPTIRIDGAFPGGNIVVDSIVNDHVYLHQDLRDNEINWFYWYFRVSGAAGKTLTFHFNHPWKQLPVRNVIGVHGPAMSLDLGSSWSWMGMDRVDGSSFSYSFASDDTEVRFSFGMPYTAANFETFLKPYEGHMNLDIGAMTLSRKGRSVERLHVGNIHGDPKYRLLITARHHACEMMANYALEGMIAAVFDNSDLGAWFRQHVEFLIIPFVDIDGVEEGDQGKGRRARDHNRDYSAESIYPSTSAIRSYVPVWSGGKLVAAFDLHCPSIRGKNHEKIYMVGLESEDHAAEQNKFADLLEMRARLASSAALPYLAANNMPFGKAWNTAGNYTKGSSFIAWVTELEEVKLASTIEFPYANASGREVTPENLRVFGHTLIEALYQYLSVLEQDAQPDVMH